MGRISLLKIYIYIRMLRHYLIYTKNIAYLSAKVCEWGTIHFDV